MKIKLLIITIAVICLGAVPILADTGVERLTLNHYGGETVLKIDVDQSFQFAHQTEIAQNGKPYRIIVDLFPAVHQLGRKNFNNLPVSIVASIRTSQFSVNPEKVVRVVLDLNEESIYRIEKKGKSVFVFIPDKSTGDFAEWKSSANIEKRNVTSGKAVASKPVKKAVEQNIVNGSAEPEKKSIVTASTKPASEKTIPIVTSVMQPKMATYYSPKRSSLIDEEMSRPIVVTGTVPGTKMVSQSPSKEKSATVSKPKSTQELAVSDDSPAKSKIQQSAPPAVKVEKHTDPAVISKPKTDTAPKAGTPDSAVENTEPAEPNLKKKAPVPTNEESKKKKEKPFKKKKSTVAINTNFKETVTAKKDESQKAVVAKKDTDLKPTSRFRRTPSMPAKLKGTIVAQFPTRMVIKYKPGIARDPFATLIDETRQTDGPSHKKIANVETLRLVGVLESSGGKNRALLEDIDGYGYILKQGDKVKKGYVSRIDSQKAYFKLFEYGWNRTVALELGE